MKTGLDSLAPDKDWKQLGIYLTSFWLNYYGICSTLHSDQGRNFEIGIFQDLCRMLEIKKKRPELQQGIQDKMVKLRGLIGLLRMIKAYLKNEQTDCDLHLGFVLQHIGQPDMKVVR